MMHNYLVVSLLITNFLFMQASQTPRKHTLTEAETAALAKTLGGGTVDNFKINVERTDTQKKAAEACDLTSDPFVNVAKKGSLTVPSHKSPRKPNLPLSNLPAKK